MSNYKALDCVTHQTLKVRNQFGKEFGDNINQALVFPTEFESLHREYPIFFRHSTTAGYYAICILGFDKSENLFLDNTHWAARYIPAMSMRGPFALQLINNMSVQHSMADPIVMVDIDDARISSEIGEPVFKTHGGYTPYFEQIMQAMQRIHVGSHSAGDFFAMLTKFDLIEPVEIAVNLGQMGTCSMANLFTISRERLAALGAEELHELNGLGLLEHCFAVVSSAGNIAHLVNMKMHSSHSPKL